MCGAGKRAVTMPLPGSSLNRSFKSILLLINKGGSKCMLPPLFYGIVNLWRCGRYLYFFSQIHSTLLHLVHIGTRLVVGEHHAHTTIRPCNRFAEQTDICFRLAQYFFQTCKFRFTSFFICKNYGAGSIAFVSDLCDRQSQ